MYCTALCCTVLRRTVEQQQRSDRISSLVFVEHRARARARGRSRSRTGRSCFFFTNLALPTRPFPFLLLFAFLFLLLLLPLLLLLSCFSSSSPPFCLAFNCNRNHVCTIRVSPCETRTKRMYPVPRNMLDSIHYHHCHCHISSSLYPH